MSSVLVLLKDVPGTQQDMSHSIIQGFHYMGLLPSQVTTVTLDIIQVYDNDPPNKDWVIEKTYQKILTGGDADTWLAANVANYNAIMTDQYNKLIADGDETGTIE